MLVSRAERDLSRVREEIGRLKDQLALAEMRAQKLVNFIEMAREYGMLTEEGEDRRPPVAAAPATIPDPAQQSGVPDKSKLVSEVVSILRESGRPTYSLTSGGGSTASEIAAG